MKLSAAVTYADMTAAELASLAEAAEPDLLLVRWGRVANVERAKGLYYLYHVKKLGVVQSAAVFGVSKQRATAILRNVEGKLLTYQQNGRLLRATGDAKQLD